MAELLVRGGRVVDGTGAPARRADVWCIDGRVGLVGPDLTLSGRAEVIDAGGLLVAPGFIDTHSHSDLRVIVEPDLPMKVMQGITLDVLGQDGISVAPVLDEHVEEVRHELAGLLGDPDIERSWRSVDDYLRVLDRGAALNLSYLVPHGEARACAMGFDARSPTRDELQRMVALVGQGMDEGALGLSTGLIYPPCCYSDTDELVALCSEVARKNGVFVVHMRSESDRILDATEEMLTVARRSGVHLHISHFKIAGRDNWPLVDQLLDKVRGAIADGVRVTADQYPYVAGSTMFGAVLPPWAHSGGVDSTVERLRSTEERAKMRVEMTATGPQDWDNFWKWTGPEGIVISDVPSGKHPEMIGKTVAQAAGEKDPVEFALDLLRDERMGVSMISFSQSEDVVAKILAEPYVNLCTDGLLGGRPHPRAFGAFPRVLGRYVRDKKVLTIEEAVRRASSQAADAMHLAGRGRVAPGQAADLVVFDPGAIEDRATFEEPMQSPVGIEHVVVAGIPVIQKGAATGKRPGRVVRRS